MRISKLFLPAATAASVLLASCGPETREASPPAKPKLIPAERLLAHKGFAEATKCDALSVYATLMLRMTKEDPQGFKTFFQGMADEVRFASETASTDIASKYGPISSELELKIREKIVRDIGRPIRSPMQSVAMLHLHCEKFESEATRKKAPEMFEKLETEIKSAPPEPPQPLPQPAPQQRLPSSSLNIA